MRHLLMLAALLMCLAAPARAGDSATFVADEDTVRVGENEVVNVGFRLQNHLLVGMYPDSLILTAENRDPGVSGLPRVRVSSLDGLVKVMAPAGSDEERAYSYSATSDFEHGLLTFRLVAHDANKQSYEFTARVVVDGSDASDRFASQFLGAGAKRVEIVRVAAQGADGRAPGVLLVHGHGAHARRQLMLAQLLAARGYHVIAMSLPGYGQSAGTPDLGGPASQAAVALAYAALLRMPNVDPRRTAMWGQGDGANAVLLVAAKRKDVAAVIAASPEVDLWASYRVATAERRSAIVAAAGSDSAQWRARSPLLAVKRLAARLCVTTTSTDDPRLLAATQAFVARFDVAGARVDGQLSDAKHHLGPGQVRQQALDFLRRRFTPPAR